MADDFVVLTIFDEFNRSIERGGDVYGQQGLARSASAERLVDVEQVAETLRREHSSRAPVTRGLPQRVRNSTWRRGVKHQRTS